MKRAAAFVGPLPPPVNGFSHMCGLMLEQMRAHMPVTVFDRAPGSSAPWRTALTQLRRAFSYLTFNLGTSSRVLYLGLSGGKGQLIDLVYVMLAKIFQRRIFVHHHSFAYINRASPLNRCFFALVRNEIHIVLSEGMGRALASRYALSAGRVRVLSNAAFFSGEQEAPVVPREAASSGTLQIGFLSNITEEKGIFVFFDLLARLRGAGIPFRARIAGPLAEPIRQAFGEALAAASEAEYVGPVYGAAKQAFYESLDLFIFPTKYVNEAEPLVLYEAMRAGVVVIACDRGAIAEMLADGGGLAVTAEGILRDATSRIEAYRDDPTVLVGAKRAALDRVRSIQRRAALELDALLKDMALATAG